VSQIAVFASLRATPGRENELAELVRLLVDQADEEPGTIIYAAHQHRKDLAVFWFYEVYADAASLEEHTARAGATMAEHADLLAERPSVTVVRGLAAKGLDF